MSTHNAECVVGNCLTPTDRVERCYWRNPYSDERSAYLSLCDFHAGMFEREWAPLQIDG